MSVIDEVKDRLDVVEVIQGYVPLKKAGRSYKGLCPFHAEKTPSFVVFPETGTWHCFGACGTGGDIFSFVMKRENLSFGETLKLLAQRAGVELEPQSPQAAEQDKRRALLEEINKSAATYFHHLLLSSKEAEVARSYLEDRGLNSETLEGFQVGYALDQWDALLVHLTGKGYALADLAEAGVIVEREDQSGYYDRFRGRVVFAIRDHRGRTIGFGARILGEGVPKYLNSPQTPLFDKSRVLFGLDQARQGIRLAGEAVIVEGYMDVLMAHQHGFNNVVAQMGTALTEAQLRHLKRYTKRFVLSLDSDAAGDQATLRGLDVARSVVDREVVPVPTARGLVRFEDRLAADIRIVALPPGQDPDEVIRQDPAGWTRLIEQAKPVMDYYFQALTADLDLSTARGKAQAVEALGPLVAEVGDRVQREHYLQQLARMVQVDERSLWQQIRNAGSTRQRSQPSRPAPEELVEPKKLVLDLDEHCLSLFLNHPALLEDAEAALEMGGDPPLNEEDLARSTDRALFSAWRQWLVDGGQPEVRAAFYDSLDESLQERVDILLQASQGQPELPKAVLRDDFTDAVVRLRLRNLQRRVRELRFLLEDAEPSEVEDSYGRLIAEAALRIRRLQKTKSGWSMAGRRNREDAPVRVPAVAE
ncbi:DNA primase [Chloroflexota bacterium]